MKRNLIKILSVTMFVSLFTVVAATRNANALSISIKDLVGGTSVVVSDGGAGDMSAIDGVVTTVDTVVGNWTANITTGKSAPYIGSTSDPMLDLTNASASSGIAGGSLEIMLTAKNFDNIGDISSFLFFAGGTTIGNVSFDLFLDSNNVEFARTGASVTKIASLGPFTPISTKDFSGSVIGALPGGLSSEFSLTIVAVVNHATKGDTGFNSNSSSAPVPEPATMFLLGSGLLGMAATKRRKKE